MLQVDLCPTFGALLNCSRKLSEDLGTHIPRSRGRIWYVLWVRTQEAQFRLPTTSWSSVLTPEFYRGLCELTHSLVCFFYPLLDNLVVLSLGLLLLCGGQMHRLQSPDSFRCLGSSCSKLYNTISPFYGRRLVFHIVLYGNLTQFDITIVDGTSATWLLWFHTYYCKVYEVFTIVVISAKITHPSVEHGLPPKEIIPYPVIAEDSTLPFLWQLECVSIFLRGKEGDQVLSTRQRYQVVLAKVLDIGS